MRHDVKWTETYDGETRVLHTELRGYILQILDDGKKDGLPYTSWFICGTNAGGPDEINEGGHCSVAECKREMIEWVTCMASEMETVDD